MRVAVVVAACSLSSPAWAQAAATPPAPPENVGEDRASKAKQLYEEGMAHFQLDEWDPAIESWQAGFRVKPAPQFLYNIAQAYRLSKRPEQALSYYKKYLYMAPKAPNRLEVDRHIQSLTLLIEAENRNSTRPPSTVLPVKPKPDAPVEAKPAPPPPAPAPVVTAPPPAPVVTAPRADLTAQAPERPITQRKWFWPVVAGGAAVAVAAVLVGAVVGTRSNPRILTAVHF
jgi:tetratricopeptide (TPR) repeat protein